MGGKKRCHIKCTNKDYRQATELLKGKNYEFMFLRHHAVRLVPHLLLLGRFLFTGQNATSLCRREKYNRCRLLLFVFPPRTVFIHFYSHPGLQSYFRMNDR